MEQAGEARMRGLIAKTHNRFYEVLVDGGVYVCSPKGAFKQAESPDYRLPVIGDRVRIELLADRGEGVDGYIVAIEPRRNVLERADADARRKRFMAANLDLALVVSAVVKPGVDFGLIDRYMVACELAEIPYALAINKVELDPGFSDSPELGIYRDLGVDILTLSAKRGDGLEALRERVGRGVSYLTGASGVGKSTLINCLAPEADLTVGAVDERKGRGRHTTTYSVLVPVGDHGFLVDSPGLRDFYPPRVDPDQVRFGFRELAAVQAECRFASCLHDREPGCAARAAVAAGRISEMRYKSYLALMREMQGRQQNQWR